MEWLIVFNVAQNALSNINTASMPLSAPLTSRLYNALSESLFCTIYFLA
jgi:hypothetical protein